MAALLRSLLFVEPGEQRILLAHVDSSDCSSMEDDTRRGGEPGEPGVTRGELTVVVHFQIWRIFLIPGSNRLSYQQT